MKSDVLDRNSQHPVRDSLVVIQKIAPGAGRISVQNEHSRGHVFSELSCTYPLKLLSPKTEQDRLAIVYIMTYGGGLVGGDSISLSVEVGPGSTLILLSQGSTKVFKDRAGSRASNLPTTDLITTQRMDVHISNGATLFLLPDPVTCFKNASYNQIQTFYLEPHASVLLLDSITSGRKSLGEEWEFSRYFSMNDVRVEGECVAKDVMLLEHQDPNGHWPLPSRSLRDKLAPYSCYATAILYGPALINTMSEIAEEYGKISVFKQKEMPLLIWSWSWMRGGKGGVLRVAGIDSETVRNSLRDMFSHLQDVVGVDTYRRAFP